MNGSSKPLTRQRLTPLIETEIFSNQCFPNRFFGVPVRFKASRFRKIAVPCIHTAHGRCFCIEIVRAAYPDATAQDPENQHFDPKATPEKPIWEMVDVRLRRALPQPLSRKELAAWPELSGMELMKRGSRLSVQPVDAKAFAFICNLAKIPRP